MSEYQDAALEYAAKGWAVFPIVPGRKKPSLIKDYYTLSSTDPEQIKAWWSLSPEANIGLDCGKSGLVAVDVDSEAGHGKDGLGALKTLQIITGKEPWDTLQSETTTGGFHYVFMAPEKGSVITNAATFGIPGIDTRSKGGYIVLPPSKIGEKRYRWKTKSEPRPFPRSLVTFSKPGVRDDAGRTEIEAILHDQEVIPEGKRDAVLIKVAGKLSSFGFSREEIATALEAVYKNRCEPGMDPMTEKDFERLAKSATGYERPSNELHEIVTSSGTVIEASGTYNKLDQAFAVDAATFLNNYEEKTEWVIDQMLQRASINMMQGPPKSGKSTLSRYLAFCVAYGIPFLGQFAVAKTPVLYYTLQENKAHLKEYCLARLKALGKPVKDIPIDFIYRLPIKGEKAVRGMRDRILDKGYGLIIIDMFLRFAGLEELNNYVEVDNATSVMNELAQDLNACIMWTHHSKKDDGGVDAFAGGIGSQALRGSVYTTIKTWKEKGRRMMATEQRHGEDLMPSAVMLDKKTLDMRIVGQGVALAIMDHDWKETELEKLYREDPSISARDAHRKVRGRYREVEAALERLRRTGGKSNQATSGQSRPAPLDAPRERTAPLSKGAKVDS